MIRRRLSVGLSWVVLVSAGACACSLGASEVGTSQSDQVTTVDGGARTSTNAAPPTAPKKETAGKQDDPSTCVWEGPPSIELTTLPHCGPKASCLPSAIVPDEAKAILAECEGGGATCVPDVFVEKNGKFVLPTCRSLYGAEGRCLTTAIPQVKAVADVLPQSTCEEGHRCLPCYDPFGGKDTTLCAQSCDHPAEPAKLAPRCCAKQGKERGVCLPKNALGQDAGAKTSGLLEEGDCVKAEPGAYLCVPQELAQVDERPASCTGSIPVVGSYRGVCVSDCFADSLATSVLGKGDCADPDTKCAPCENPRDGAPTGLPGCASADGGAGK